MLAGGDSRLAVAGWGRDPASGAPLAGRLGDTRTKTPYVAPSPRIGEVLDAVAPAVPLPSPPKRTMNRP